MALHWDIDSCENWKELVNDNEWGKTNALIWSTMVIGMHKITKENVDEFYTRIKLVEKGTGALAVLSDGEYFFTREDIARRIGLFTNSTRLTDAQFNKHLVSIMKREVAKA